MSFSCRVTIKSSVLETFVNDSVLPLSQIESLLNMQFVCSNTQTLDCTISGVHSSVGISLDPVMASLLTCKPPIMMNEVLATNKVD